MYVLKQASVMITSYIPEYQLCNKFRRISGNSEQCYVHPTRLCVSVQLMCQVLLFQMIRDGKLSTHWFNCESSTVIVVPMLLNGLMISSKLLEYSDSFHRIYSCCHAIQRSDGSDTLEELNHDGGKRSTILGTSSSSI